MEQFIRIENKHNFLIGELPNYYPGTSKYLAFWRQEVKKCIEGLWAFDNGGFRWMPPNLYFYVNYGTILKSINRIKYRSKPDLRDVDWEFMYNIMECKGFSGFELDDEYSCNAALINNELPLTNNCYKSNGELKTYMPARQYIRKLHDRILGKALFENKYKNLFWLASRGQGKSYLVSIGIILYTFLFDNKRYIEDVTPEVEIFVGAALSDKSGELLNKFKSGLDNLPGAYKTHSEYFSPPFFKKTSGELKPSNAKNPFINLYDTKEKGTWVKKGTRSKIIHGVFTIENPDAAAGFRPAFLVVEEVGLMSNVLAVHAQNEACLRDGDEVIGVSIYIGTGGNMEKIVESETIFRDPEAYNFLSFDDVYENTGKIGWFVPYHYAIAQAKDENGNTDLKLAQEIIDRERRVRKGNKNSAKSLDRYVMSYPITPSEMFLSSKGSFFPVYELKQRVKELKENNLYLKLAKPIHIWFDSNSKNKVNYKIDSDNELNPLLEYRRPKDYDSIEGAPVIYEFPIEVNGVIPDGLYIAGLDHYHSDELDEGESLASFWIMKTYKHPNLGYSEIVASYTGKMFGGKNKVNELIEKMLMMYNISNGYFFFENNKGNTVEYFTKKNKLGYLASSPKTVLSSSFRKEINRTTINYGYEISNRVIKLQALDYVRDWLLETRTIDGKTFMNLDLIPDLGLAQELMNYNIDHGNWDRVSGLVGCILGLRELQNEFAEKETKRVLTAASFFSQNKKVFVA